MEIQFSFSAWEITHSCQDADYCAQTMCDGIYRICENGTCTNFVFGYFLLFANEQQVDNWILCEDHMTQTTESALKDGLKWLKPQMA